MRMRHLPLFAIAFLLALCLTFSGVSAAWTYYEGEAPPIQNSLALSIGSFHYGTLYITKVELSDGTYSQATVTKSGDLSVSADLTLTASGSSSATATVTLYNSTDVSYYYNKTETLSSDNDGIVYEVSGIAQKDEIPAKSFKSVNVTFSYKDGSVSSDRAVLTELQFNFVVDKDSIGAVVAQTAVGRFQDILNNVVSADSYQTMENAMNNRGGSFNKASAVTYIGNVAGSSSGDSATLNGLFGNEFMSMDLDGDGKAEPITMMVKRENLDNNLSTGDAYSYTSWGNTYTVSGVEMTLYITSQDLSNVSSGADVVVWAATFTLPEGESQWIQIVPLTKGKAEANNYNGWGSANSFNTDTWVSDDGKTIETLVAENLNQ